MSIPEITADQWHALVENHGFAGQLTGQVVLEVTVHYNQGRPMQFDIEQVRRKVVGKVKK